MVMHNNLREKGIYYGFSIFFDFGGRRFREGISGIPPDPLIDSSFKAAFIF